MDTGGDVLLVERFFNASIERTDWRDKEAAVCALGSVMASRACEKLTPSAGFDFALRNILNALKLSPNKRLRYTVVSFLRSFFEFQHRATVETLLALEQSTCEQIFDVLLGSIDDGPDVAENACYAVCFLAKCCPYSSNILDKFFEQCVWSLHRAAHKDVGQSGLRMAAYGALHEVLRFVAAPVISKWVSCIACDLENALDAMDTTFGEKFIQHECRGLEIVLHRLGESEVAESFLKQHLDEIAKLLLKVFSRTKDVDCWKDAVIAIGALAHAVGPAFENNMLTFLSFWISGIKYMRAAELYNAMVGVVIRLSRALKGKILAYCHDILSQLHQDLFSTDLDEISRCSILCCNAELALAIGANFHNHLAPTMFALQELILRKYQVLSKPEGRHLICAMVEIHLAITQCFKEPSVSNWLRPFVSDILNFLHLICSLDMDARVATAAIFLVRRLADVTGDIFSLLIYEDKRIQSFLNQCSISKDPLVKTCANRAKNHLLAATYNLRRHLLELEVNEKLHRALTLNPLQDQENEYSEQQLLSFFHNLPQGVDPYETNSITYDSLSIILSNDEEQVAKRILAGQILLTALRFEKKWDHLAYRASCCISKCLVKTLFSGEAKACLMAGEILKHITGLGRTTHSIWSALRKFLCSDVDHQQLCVKEPAIQILADVFKNFGPSLDRPSPTLINELHNAIFIKSSEHSDSVILNFLQILQYSYFSLEELSDDIRIFIFDVAECPKFKVKAAALECLTALCSSFEFDLPEESRVRSVILKSMEETDKCVAYQAIVFWIPLCQKEMEEEDDTRFVMETSESLVAILLKILFTRNDPDQHEETPNLTKAAFKCLYFVAQTIGNKIIHLVDKDVLKGIESSDVWQKEAGIQAFGSILVGPTGQALSSLITSAFSKVLHAVECCTDNSLSYAVTWTLSQIFEFHHLIVKKLMVREYQHVFDFLLLRLKDNPIVAKDACNALSSLVQGVDRHIWDNLAPYFDVLVRSLYAVGHGESVGFLELKVAAYEALHEFMKCAEDENFELMLSLTTVIMNDLFHALEAEECTIEELKNQCRSLFVITQKLGTSEYRPYFMQHVHQLITLLMRVLECESVSVFKEAMLAVGAIAYVDGGAFEEHMGELEKSWELGVQNFEQHSEIYLVMLSVIVDVSRVQKKKMLQFCDKIIIPLSIDASNGQRKEIWGASISCICEIAGAVGDKKFLKRAIDMLQDKTWFGIDRAYHLDVSNILYLRPGLVEAYRAIFQGLENYPISDPLHQFADDTLDVLLEFSKLLFLTNEMDRVMARRVIEVFEHLRTLISQSSLEKYSEFGQALVDYLCKPRPSVIKLVEDSSQSESSEKKSMNLVGGRKLVEVYAVHVLTEQPCDLYGTIKVNAGIVSQCLYNQERGDAEPVSSEETSLFINVLEPIPGVEGVTLEVDLKHKVGDSGASTDGEVCRNKTTMISGGDAHKGYNRPVEATTEGKHASVRISFIEFDCAIPAYVKVTVLWPPKGIHGQVTAYNMRYPSIRRELFRRNSANGIDHPGIIDPKINLYEGVVAVPLNSILVVKADFWCIAYKRKLSNRFGKFSAEFNVTPDRSTSKEFFGNQTYGRTTIVEVHFGIRDI